MTGGVSAFLNYKIGFGRKPEKFFENFLMIFSDRGDRNLCYQRVLLVLPMTCEKKFSVIFAEIFLWRCSVLLRCDAVDFVSPVFACRSLQNRSGQRRQGLEFK